MLSGAVPEEDTDRAGVVALVQDRLPSVVVNTAEG